VVQRSHSANGTLKQFLFGQSMLFCGQCALAFGFLPGLFVGQGLANSRQFLQGFGFQK
jgi:hypothetical protein